MALPFNTAGFAPAQARWSLMRRTLSGPMSLSGQQQVVATPGGAWRASFAGMLILSPAALNLWRGFVASADGGASDFDVDLCDRLQAPWPLSGGSPNYAPGGIVMSLTADADLNETEILITRTTGSAPAAGMHFSLTGTRWGKRLYRLASVTDLGGGAYSAQIRPGLREDLLAGAALDFETPSCVMRVEDPEAIEPTVDMLRFGEAGVTFVESFIR